MLEHVLALCKGEGVMYHTHTFQAARLEGGRTGQSKLVSRTGCGMRSMSLAGRTQRLGSPITT
jgi:hypothetical protein